jgi:pimeloyl-ACP methyl ester carboxylesterase/class 3 adenylate cyclase
LTFDGSVPPVRYAESGDLSIAYQVLGDGPGDLIYTPGWISNIEVMWEEPVLASIFRRLATFSRLIVFDKRGTGLSDAVPLDELPGLEERMDDVRAVMDAAGSERATLFGHSEGGNMCQLFAATHPDRVDGLILAATYAKRLRSADYPWAPTEEQRLESIEETKAHWGDPEHIPDYMLVTRRDDPAFRQWLARYMRFSATPKAAAHLLAMNTLMDTRAVLPLIQAPTLCIYRTDDTDVSVEEGRWIASQIPNAKFVELPGEAHLFFAVEPGPFVDEIEEFMTGRRESRVPERTLATVLYTDLVDSTGQAAEMGDTQWAQRLERHNALVRSELVRYRGTEVDNAGDGFLAVFDGPGRAIRAAMAIRSTVTGLGMETRAGIHTGEVETLGGKYAGMALHIGARIAALAAGSEILVSRTVKDLVVGSGFEFEDRGEHQLKGVPESWSVFSVV